MKARNAYSIPFVGLKLGIHEFEFEIRDAFFDALDYSIIHKGEVDVRLRLEKKETMMIAEFSILGKVFTTCDRCNDPVEVAVKGQYKVIFTFGNEPSDDENLIVLHPDAYELDLYEPMYEFITVSLPSRLVHKQGECNEEMLRMLEQYSARFEDQQDDDTEDDWDDDDDEWEDEDEDYEDDPIDPK